MEQHQKGDQQSWNDEHCDDWKWVLRSLQSFNAGSSPWLQRTRWSNDPRVPNRCWAWSLGLIQWHESNCIFKRWISGGCPRLLRKIVIMEFNVVWWMGHSAWFLLAWLVVAAGSAWKFWRLTGAYRTKIQSTHNTSTQFRQQLEKSWQRDGGNKNDLKMR